MENKFKKETLEAIARKHQSDEWLNAKCPVCGKRFHVKPCKLKTAKRRFCSKECFIEAKREDMSGEKNHQYGLRGEKNASWKGGRKYTNYGYYAVYVADHPFGTKKQHLVFEHRLVAEKHLLTEENSVEINGKRYLKPEYDVHHIDFDRTNNDPSNLLVLKKDEHKKLHAILNPAKRNSANGRFQKDSDRVPFKKVVDTAIIPTRATEGAAGYDMYAELKEPITIAPYKCVMIKSGVAMICPKGHAGFIFARSGLSTKQGLRPSTCVSVIDQDYRGEIGLPMRNDSCVPQVINPHDRIAQLVFLPVLTPTIEIVDSFDDATERGNAGFGSTGR